MAHRITLITRDSNGPDITIAVTSIKTVPTIVVDKGEELRKDIIPQKSAGTAQTADTLIKEL